MQNGLRDELMAAPAVSGAQNYDQLCLSTRNEEKRLLELKKRRAYTKVQHAKIITPQTNSSVRKTDGRLSTASPQNRENRFVVRCYVCNKLGHVAKDCRSRPSESCGKGSV